MRKASAFFVVNLIQDVNIIQPLVLLAAKGTSLDVGLLVSTKFCQSDATGRWMRELRDIAWHCGIDIHHFGSAFDGMQILSGRNGILVAASESNLLPHKETHDLFRSAPPGFVTLTLQHGFEGVGFLHSREHDVAHGRGVSFAADIVCGWFDAARQASMLPSQKPKLFVTGPGCVLTERFPIAERSHTGIICENLHSIRFTANSGTQGDFVQYFETFCNEIDGDNRRVVLRPHPAGQFSVRNKLKLPLNASMNNEPMYKVALSSFAYGISAASSVIIDMLLADIPVAVWRDDNGAMDVSAFDGLTVVKTAQDWVDFSRKAVADPEPFLEMQRAFLDRQGMPRDPEDVRRRFASVFEATAAAAPEQVLGPRAANRILLAVRDDDGGMTRMFRSPLQALSAPVDISVHSLAVSGARKVFGSRMLASSLAAWMQTRLTAVDPTLVVIRDEDMDTPESNALVDASRRKRIPVAVFLGALEPDAEEDREADALLLERLIATADIVCGPPARLSRVRGKLERSGIAACELTGLDGHKILSVGRTPSNETARNAGQIRRICALAARPKRSRVLFVCPTFLPTLQLSFIKPFETVAGKQAFVYSLITQDDINAQMKTAESEQETRAWIAESVRNVSPDLIVFCRYGGPHEDVFLDYAATANVPTIYHIDDDLLNVPVSIGEKKALVHNDPRRLAAVRHLLNAVDLVYCSTEKLKTRLTALGIRTPIRAGSIYCAGKVIAPAERRPVRKIGYMASADHAQNLEMVLPAVIDVLRRHPDVTFELFGSIQRPDALGEFGDRVRSAPPVRNYEAFLEEFATHEWDIGICPLVPIDFNMVKANTKWVEYSAIGTAVVASRGTVYDDCTSDGCGIAADGVEEWLAAFETLMDPERRYVEVRNAQDRLSTLYTVDKLFEQIVEVFAEAAALRQSVRPLPENVAVA